jgi:hypothetical protein
VLHRGRVLGTWQRDPKAATLQEWAVLQDELAACGTSSWQQQLQIKQQPQKVGRDIWAGCVRLYLQRKKLGQLGIW